MHNGQFLFRLRMKHARILLPCLCALFVGCVEYQQILTLNPDGSGTLDVTYRVDSDTAQALLQSGMPGNDRGAGVPGRLFDEKQVREDFAPYEAEGVELTFVDITATGRDETMRLGFRFDDLNGILRTPFFAQSTVSLRRDARGDLVLTQTLSGAGPEWGPVIDLSEEKSDAALREQLHGVIVEFRFVVPGAIRTANADRVDGRTAVWVFDPSVDPDALARARKAQFRIVFDGSDSSLPEVGPQQIRLSLTEPGG